MPKTPPAKKRNRAVRYPSVVAVRFGRGDEDEESFARIARAAHTLGIDVGPFIRAAAAERATLVLRCAERVRTTR